jgi:hypothetical protein
LIEHGPHWINFIVFTFISEKQKYFRRLYKFGTKYFFSHEKKVKFKTHHKKNEEKGEFENLQNESLYFNGGTPSCLDLPPSS